MKNNSFIKFRAAKSAFSAATVSIMANFCLFILKLLTGIFTDSTALISDAAHSAADTAAAVAVAVGIKMSEKSCDDCHQYGHEKYESMTSLLLSTVLFAASIGIAVSAVKSIMTGAVPPSDGTLAAAVSLISIASKELLFRFTYRSAKALSSEALFAEAWHHRSDAMASVASLFGITASKLGAPVFDPLAGAAIAIFIFKAAVGIFRDASHSIVDSSAPEKTRLKIRNAALKTDAAISISELLTRTVGDAVYIEMAVTLPPDMPLSEAQKKTELMRYDIMREVECVKRCTVRAVTK